MSGSHDTHGQRNPQYYDWGEEIAPGLFRTIVHCDGSRPWSDKATAIGLVAEGLALAASLGACVSYAAVEAVLRRGSRPEVIQYRNVLNLAEFDGEDEGCEDVCADLEGEEAIKCRTERAQLKVLAECLLVALINGHKECPACRWIAEELGIEFDVLPCLAHHITDLDENRQAIANVKEFLNQHRVITVESIGFVLAAGTAQLSLDDVLALAQSVEERGI